MQAHDVPAMPAQAVHNYSGCSILRLASETGDLNVLREHMATQNTHISVEESPSSISNLNMKRPAGGDDYPRDPMSRNMQFNQGTEGEIQGTQDGITIVTISPPAGAMEKMKMSEQAGGMTIISMAPPPLEQSLTAQEAEDAYRCVQDVVAQRYKDSGHVLARIYDQWSRMSYTPFYMEQMGGRYVALHANERAINYRDNSIYRERDMPVGGVIAAPSFSVQKNGQILIGPLILVEKINQGFNPVQGNWRYTTISPQGEVLGATQGNNAEVVQICPDCLADKTDVLFLTLMKAGVTPKQTAETTEN
jgi:hypothetical protein